MVKEDEIEYPGRLGSTKVNLPLKESQETLNPSVVLSDYNTLRPIVGFSRVCFLGGVNNIFPFAFLLSL